MCIFTVSLGRFSEMLIERSPMRPREQNDSLQEDFSKFVGLCDESGTKCNSEIDFISSYYLYFL